MAQKEFYHDLDLVKVSQLLNTRVQNVTTTERNTLAATLGAGNVGLIVYDTTLSQPYFWNGSLFSTVSASIDGDVIFKGIISSVSNPTVEKVKGNQYVINTSGTLTITSVTILPSAVVDVGDVLLFTSATEAYVLQRNDEQATESLLGNVRLASQAEVNAGTVADEVVTPATLTGFATAKAFAKVYFNGAVSLTASTPATVTHNLNLQNKDAFTIRVADSTGSDISVDIDSVNVNSLTLTSVISLTNVKVTIIGF